MENNKFAGSYMERDFKGLPKGVILVGPDKNFYLLRDHNYGIVEFTSGEKMEKHFYFVDLDGYKHSSSVDLLESRVATDEDLKRLLAISTVPDIVDIYGISESEKVRIESLL